MTPTALIQKTQTDSDCHKAFENCLFWPKWM